MSQRPLINENRFYRHRLAVAVTLAVITMAMCELASAAWIMWRGDWHTRFAYPYNSVPSGYTVYRHTPRQDWSGATIRRRPEDPAVVLDDAGFICDEPVSEQKPDGVIRVFLMGGSTALGCGQITAGYGGIHPYPQGFYSYPHSIAGMLKQYLQRAYPQHRFQVITAAVAGRRIHQSLGEYLASVSHFAPDIVISLDGNNDLLTFVFGKPYEEAATDFDTYMTLWYEQHHAPFWKKSATWYAGTKMIEWLGLRRDGQAALSNVVRHDTANSWDEYQRYRSRFSANARDFLQTLRHFRAAVSADGAHFIFALQPLLYRRGTNKPLSDIEARFDQLLFTPSKYSQDDQIRGWLASRYFFDDFLVRAIRAEGAGVFIDMNAELQGVPRESEVYADFCHLTFEGNRLVAEAIGKACAGLIH